jgi:hypothetical protein
MHCLGVLASRAKAATARELVARNGSDREKSHVEVLALGMGGQPAKSLERALAHLDSWPRDAVIMSPPLGAFGLFAFSGMVWGCGTRACDLYGPRAAKGVDGAADHRRKRRHVPALALVYGHPVPQQIWDDAAARTERAFPTAGVAFADVHVGLAVPRSCNWTTQFTRPPAARSSRPRRP